MAHQLAQQRLHEDLFVSPIPVKHGLHNWTFSVPGRQLNLTEIILARVLEHYTLVHPARSQVSIKTYRSTFPTLSDPNSSSTRYLSTLTHSASSAETLEGKDEETAYLFLEVRSAREARGSQILYQDATIRNLRHPLDPVPKGEKEDGLQVDTEVVDGPDGSTLDEDGFEIVDRPSEDPMNAPSDDNVPVARPPSALPVGGALPVGVAPAVGGLASPIPGQTSNFSTLAVRPAANVLPILQQLMSPFVLGLTKAARAAASTIQEAAAPTLLPGAAFHLTTHTFPALSPPMPPLALTVYSLPNASAGSVFLKAEWQGCHSPKMAEQVLREFLDGCLPEGVGGERKFLVWEGGRKDGKDGWEGTERTRRTVHLLLRALRESSFI